MVPILESLSLFTDLDIDCAPLGHCGFGKKIATSDFTKVCGDHLLD